MTLIKAIGLSFAMCGLAAAAEDAPTISAQISKLEGKWTTKKIEITDREAFGAVTDEDIMTISFDPKGGTHWALDLKASGQKPELKLLYMVGANHIGFHGGPAGTTGEVQVWHYTVSDEQLVLETVPKGAKLTFEKVTKAQPTPAK